MDFDAGAGLIHGEGRLVEFFEFRVEVAIAFAALLLSGELVFEGGEVLDEATDFADELVFVGEVLGFGEGDFCGGAFEEGLAFDRVGEVEAEEHAELVLIGPVRGGDGFVGAADEAALDGFVLAVAAGGGAESIGFGAGAGAVGAVFADLVGVGGDSVGACAGGDAAFDFAVAADGGRT